MPSRPAPGVARAEILSDGMGMALRFPKRFSRAYMLAVLCTNCVLVLVAFHPSRFSIPCASFSAPSTNLLETTPPQLANEPAPNTGTGEDVTLPRGCCCAGSRVLSGAHGQKGLIRLSAWEMHNVLVLPGFLPFQNSSALSDLVTPSPVRT